MDSNFKLVHCPDLLPSQKLEKVSFKKITTNEYLVEFRKSIYYANFFPQNRPSSLFHVCISFLHPPNRPILLTKILVDEIFPSEQPRRNWTQGERSEKSVVRRVDSNAGWAKTRSTARQVRLARVCTGTKVETGEEGGKREGGREQEEGYRELERERDRDERKQERGIFERRSRRGCTSGC